MPARAGSTSSWAYPLRVIGHEGSPPAVPGDKGLGARRGEVALREQLLGILADQEGAVRPRADEGRIIQRLFEQDVDHGQGQGSVAARSHPEPEVRFVDHAGLVRVDNDELGTRAFARLIRRASVG